MRCRYCEKTAVYKCKVCGSLLCTEHTRLGTICAPPVQKLKFVYTISKVTSSKDKSAISNLVREFWGEEEQLTFDRKFVVARLSAYAAKLGKSLIGFVSFVDIDSALIVVALGILPLYQSSRVGSRLMRKVENEAKRLGKKEMLVSTSNEDLPALAFYQSLGFRIFEVKPDVIAEKHGTILQGIGGLPIRDELRLRKTIR